MRQRSENKHRKELKRKLKRLQIKKANINKQRQKIEELNIHENKVSNKVSVAHSKTTNKQEQMTEINRELWNKHV